MNNNWYCIKCKTWNESEKTRCGFCSNPKPEHPEEVIAQVENHGVEKLRVNLHDIIEKLPHNARVRTFRWLEDNVL